MKAVLIPGDGVGKEITESVKTISQQLVPDLEWQSFQAGADYYERSGKLIQDGLLEAVEEDKIALKGPTATPIGTGFRSINVMLRQHFSTYANLRPVHSFEGVPSRFEHVDLVIIRENTEDLYRGVEYMYDADTAHGIKIITHQASEKIIRFAFDYARSHHRKKVTAVHKANIMKLTDGLFLNTFKQTAEKYPDIESNDVIVDAACMKLVTDPSQFDVIVTENLYGDILSDLCAGLAGGLGFAPSANIGEKVRIYEAVHGSAPDIAGKNIANPTSILLSFAMLLHDVGCERESAELQKAVEEVIAEGTHTTADIGGTAGTKEFTAAILEKL